MPPSPFAALRAQYLDRYPDRHRMLDDLGRQLAETLAKNPHAVIDDRILSQQMDADQNLVKNALVGLVDLKGLRTRLFWQCANGFGTVKEADHIRDLPHSVDCDRCGETHLSNNANVEVFFVATEELVTELQRSED